MTRWHNGVRANDAQTAESMTAEPDFVHAAEAVLSSSFGGPIRLDRFEVLKGKRSLEGDSVSFGRGP